MIHPVATAVASGFDINSKNSTTHASACSGKQSTKQTIDQNERHTHPEHTLSWSITIAISIFGHCQGLLKIICQTPSCLEQLTVPVCKSVKKNAYTPMQGGFSQETQIKVKWKDGFIFVYIRRFSKLVAKIWEYAKRNTDPWRVSASPQNTSWNIHLTGHFISSFVQLSSQPIM